MAVIKKLLEFEKFYYLLILIFLLALALRLIYFPENVYFASDQARDAYYSFEVIKGDFKVVGPGTTLSKNVHHGVFYYYLMAPVYYLAQGSPFIPALIIIILSGVGAFIVFLIGKDLFNIKIGLVAAFLYAISYEQTQYALFFSHPGLALIFVLLFYLGLTKFIFKGNSKGIILSALSAGLATQLHFSLVILIMLLPVYVILFRSDKTRIKSIDLFLAFLAFGLSMSTFIVAEVKYGHLRAFVGSLGEASGSMFGLYIDNFINTVNRYFTDNLFVFLQKPVLGLVVVIALFGYLIKNKKQRKRGVLLLLWFLTGCVAYLVGDATTYYFGIGGSVGLLICMATLIESFWRENKAVAVTILFAIIGSNLSQVIKVNAYGPIDSIMAPSGMLLMDELRAIDYIYTQAGNEEFSIHALTIPYNVKSTWDYLFNWYGKKEYGFVPVWGGEDALGSEGTLIVINARSSLPTKQFLIIEPLVGLPDKFVKDFFKEEDYFTRLKDEKKFGLITVQTREKY